jgi:hypothetical protein
MADHLTAKLTLASPDRSPEKAAATMVRGGFLHLSRDARCAPVRRR